METTAVKYGKLCLSDFEDSQEEGPPSQVLLEGTERLLGGSIHADHMAGDGDQARGNLMGRKDMENHMLSLNFFEGCAEMRPGDTCC